MTNAPDLLVANLLEVFDERDPAQRQSAIDRLHAPGVVFTDAEGTVEGRGALHAKAQAILDQAPPEFAFVVAGAAAGTGDVGLVRWTFGPAGGAPVVRGTDVAIIVDGRIAKLYTMLHTERDSDDHDAG